MCKCKEAEQGQKSGSRGSGLCPDRAMMGVITGHKDSTRQEDDVPVWASVACVCAGSFGHVGEAALTRQHAAAGLSYRCLPVVLIRV